MSRCLDRGLVRLNYFEGARLESADLNELVRYEEYLLALHVCAVHGCALARLTQRRARPRLAHGVAGGSDLSWQIDDDELAATVSTTAASFARVPRYFATLSNASFSRQLVGPFIRVEQPRSASFVVRLRFAIPAQLNTDSELRAARTHLQRATVQWVAVEPVFDDLYGAGDES